MLECRGPRSAVMDPVLLSLGSEFLIKTSGYCTRPLLAIQPKLGIVLGELIKTLPLTRLSMLLLCSPTATSVHLDDCQSPAWDVCIPRLGRMDGLNASLETVLREHYSVTECALQLSPPECTLFSILDKWVISEIELYYVFKSFYRAWKRC